MTVDEQKEYDAQMAIFAAEKPSRQLSQIRRIRNEMLLGCDWTQLPNAPLTDEKKKEWATYRQSLRDMTKTYSTVPLDKKGYMDWYKITWPTKPE